jgi:hypothetical protein
VFFEPPPPPPEEPQRERRAQPPWHEKPRGVVPAGVPLELVLAREPKLAVALCRLGACSDGFDAELIVLGSEDLDEEINGGMFGAPSPRRRKGERVDPARALRFGVQYADGSKAELERHWQGRDERPDGPVIRTRGGQGGDGEWLQRLWFWPLPPPGTITFALEWLAQGIELQRHELDAAPIREAAERAQTLMPTQELADTPGYTSHTMRPHRNGEQDSA